MNNSIFTIEAVRNPNSFLHVPNLHILIKKSKDDKNVWVGDCLDINICAYSDKKNKNEAIKEIFSTITEMAIEIILHLLKKGTIKDLFKCSEENSGKWKTFNNYNNIKKIDNLIKSYKKYISQSKYLLKGEIIETSLNKEQIKLIIENIIINLESQKIYELKTAA